MEPPSLEHDCRGSWSTSSPKGYRARVTPSFWTRAPLSPSRSPDLVRRCQRKPGGCLPSPGTRFLTRRVHVSGWRRALRSRLQGKKVPALSCSKPWTEGPEPRGVRQLGAGRNENDLSGQFSQSNGGFEDRALNEVFINPTRVRCNRKLHPNPADWPGVLTLQILRPGDELIPTVGARGRS